MALQVRTPGSPPLTDGQRLDASRELDDQTFEALSELYVRLADRLAAVETRLAAL